MTRLVLIALLMIVTSPTASAASRPDIILITLDTTRADAIGAYGKPGEHRASTPNLDRLAAGGVRYASAFSPSPLTLPAHASLLSGLDPRAHGLRDNGSAVLPPTVPTLATVLRARGYQTAAFVSSRVLDHRFGLNRGFDVYDDFIPAEQLGELGYAERTAGQVTGAALEWAANATGKSPYFLWIHYYDPHSPYQPPDGVGRRSLGRAYAAEITYVDEQIGRLLGGLEPDATAVIAVVGDHGESLGEHGEETHGVFLYRSVLEVPMILAGGSAPAGAVVNERVSTTRLPRTLLSLSGIAEQPAMATVLPGLGKKVARPAIIYSESYMPATAYGWSPLKSAADQRWHAIVAPRPELYDLQADPNQRRNVINDNRREFFRMRGLIEAYEEGMVSPPAGRAAADSELAAAIRSLGYMSGLSGRAGTLDPKDGMVLLEESRRANLLLESGDVAAALPIFTRLVRENPTNVPFLTDLALAQLRSGATEQALATYRRALALNPALDFLHQNLADALRQAGQIEEAVAEYRIALQLNRRFAAASLRLAQIAQDEGRPAEALKELRRSVAAGTRSASVSTMLARLELDAGRLEVAEREARSAIEIAAGWAPAWIVLGDVLERKDQIEPARRAWGTAAGLDPRHPAAPLRLGRLARQNGDQQSARQFLQRVLTIAPRSAEAQEARRLLAKHSP